jgi:hypothetical protein
MIVVFAATIFASATLGDYRIAFAVAVARDVEPKC